MADSRSLREANRAAVLDLLRRSGPMTRSELAWESALAKPTVSFIVDMLVDEGVAVEVGAGQSHPKGGPRGRLIALNPEATAIVGVHFGVRETTLALASALGEVRSTRTVPTHRGQAARALQELPELVVDLLGAGQVPLSRLGGIGVAVPGLVGRPGGTCVLAPNLEWRNVPVQAALSESMGLPVKVCNSVQAGGVAELYLGGHEDDTSLAWIYVDDGVGAAIVTEGKILSGQRGYAGEFGHWKLSSSGRRCACGHTGCLETVASGQAIEVSARELALQRSREISFALESTAIATAASQGDPCAQALLAEPAQHLGRAVAGLVDLLDVELVVLDGPIARSGAFFVEAVRAAFESSTVSAEAVPLLRSRVEGDPALHGAVFTGLEASGAGARHGSRARTQRRE